LNALTEQARRDLSVRYFLSAAGPRKRSSGKSAHHPTIASIIGAMQAQEALKIIHGYQ
jgi:hypothetical protein